MLSISVIICAYNRAASLGRVIQSLLQQSIPLGLCWEVIVVDNDSVDSTQGVVEEFARNSRVNIRYVLERQQGKSFALNRGVEEARGEILLFTDDDVTIDRCWLANMSRAFDEFGCLGIGGKVLPVWSQPKPRWLELEGPYALRGPVVYFDLGEEPKKFTTPVIIGANMGFRKEAFEKYGLFRTDLVPVRSGEDSEFCDRLLNGGEKLIYLPSSVVFHPVDPERATKQYVLSWYFHATQFLTRWQGWPEGTICYFGVPRYLVRKCLESFVKSLLALDETRRFYNKAQMYKAAGAIFEAYRIGRARAASASHRMKFGHPKFKH